MKQLLILALCAITCTAMGQKPISKPSASSLSLYGDTIELSFPLHQHYIKIGATVYKITEHEPTIELAPPASDTIFPTTLRPLWQGCKECVPISIDTSVMSWPWRTPSNMQLRF